MRETGGEPPIRGFIFACTDDTEEECLTRMLFGTDRVYGPVVIRVRRGDLLFLNNMDSDRIYGVFKAVSDGGFKIQPEAWGGKYPYQVEVEILGDIIELDNAKQILRRFKIKRNTPLYGKKLLQFLDLFLQKITQKSRENSEKPNKTYSLIAEEKEKIRRRMGEVDIMDEIPIIEATTLFTDSSSTT